MSLPIDCGLKLDHSFCRYFALDVCTRLASPPLNVLSTEYIYYTAVFQYSYVAVAHASRLFSKYPDCCSLIKRPISRLYSIPKDHHRLSINFLASATHSDHQPAFHTSGFTRQLCSPAGRRTQREHPYSAGPASVQASSNYPHNCTRQI